MAYASMQTLEGHFDWCDSRAVREMQAYITDENLKWTAPPGDHDDCLMARMITAYVAHRIRPGTDLWHEPEVKIYKPTSNEARMRWMANRNDEEADDDDFA